MSIFTCIFRHVGARGAVLGRLCEFFDPIDELAEVATGSVLLADFLQTAKPAELKFKSPSTVACLVGCGDIIGHGFFDFFNA